MKLNSLFNLIAVLGCTTLILGCASATDAGPAVDLRIVGGTVFDGSGAPGAQDHVVEVIGDQIVYVGPARGGAAQRTIDATGKIVAPGFIDPHTHAYGDLSNPQRSANLPYLFQGVSTVFVGNDGGVGRYDEVAANLAKVSVGTNVGVFSGHGVFGSSP